MLRTSLFWFKRLNPVGIGVQRAITRPEVQTPGAAVAADITALYALDGHRGNVDPNTYELYGTWTGTPNTYEAHSGILSDNGFDRYLSSGGIQVSDWGAGALDTYYNADGITLSWIQRLVPATNARLMQYWQADLEHIDLFMPDIGTIRLSVVMDTGSSQSADVSLSDLELNTNTFHHFMVTFDPSGDRVGRLYVDGSLEIETEPVAGTTVFGTTVDNVRRGIGFGCSYTAPDANPSGAVDHCTILKGDFSFISPDLGGRMMHSTIFMRYFGDQMYYNPGATPIEGDVLYGVEVVYYGIEVAVYTPGIETFSSGVPQYAAYFE